MGSVATLPAEDLVQTAETFAANSSAERNVDVDRQPNLAIVIQQRIESRLRGRVRNLAVRIRADTVVLEGQCATYYTKQLAQHAALGVLDDEQLENAITVRVAR